MFDRTIEISGGNSNCPETWSPSGFFSLRGSASIVSASLRSSWRSEMLATTLNVEFDPDRSWDEKKEIYRISNKIVRTANVTQSAVGDKRGLWTTVIASAIFIFD